jgi:hypothetical protein
MSSSFSSEQLLNKGGENNPVAPKIAINRRSSIFATSCQPYQQTTFFFAVLVGLKVLICSENNVQFVHFAASDFQCVSGNVFLLLLFFSFFFLFSLSLSSLCLVFTHRSSLGVPCQESSGTLQRYAHLQEQLRVENPLLF